MNFASWRSAYCLFPDMTLKQKGMHLIRMQTLPELIAYDKYISRGFKELTLDAAKTFQEFNSLRTVGDKFCHNLMFSDLTVNNMTIETKAAEPEFKNRQFIFNNNKKCMTMVQHQKPQETTASIDDVSE